MGWVFLGGWGVGVSTSGLYADWLTRRQCHQCHLAKNEMASEVRALPAKLDSMDCLLERSYYVKTHTPATSQSLLVTEKMRQILPHFSVAIN